MTAQHQLALAQIVEEIQRKWGKDSIHTLGTLEKREPTIPLVTGFVELDRALESIPNSALTLLRGIPTAGSITVAYHIMAQAQHQGNVIAYVDCTGTFDGQYATKVCNLDESHFIHIEPGDTRDGLAITRDLVSLAYRGLIVVDMGLLEPFDRALADELSNTLRTINLLLRRSMWTGIVLLPATLLPTLDMLAALILSCKWERWIEQRGVTSGYIARVIIKKHPRQPPGGSVSIAILRDGAMQ
jgi:hypothetical protein